MKPNRDVSKAFTFRINKKENLLFLNRSLLFRLWPHDVLLSSKLHSLSLEGRVVKISRILDFGKFGIVRNGVENNYLLVVLRHSEKQGGFFNW